MPNYPNAAGDTANLTPGAVMHGAPVLGEHTREVLLEYGYTPEEIDALAAESAIYLTS